MMQLKKVKPSVCCWVCHARQDADTWSVHCTWMPDGWRRVRRGFAGWVTICPACNAAGRRFQRDAPHWPRATKGTEEPGQSEQVGDPTTDGCPDCEGRGDTPTAAATPPTP